ncbi:MAG: phospholipase D-like domain-containing protein [Mariniphaga sp.]
MQIAVFFTDIKQEIIANLKRAKHEIKVSVAWLTDEDIFRTLTQKSEAGLDVQIVISDSKENFRSTSKLKDFIQHNGKLYVATQKFLHNKFCIIDDTTIINGSYNWTYYAQKNEENIMRISIDKNLTEDADLLKRFSQKHNFFCNKISKLISNILELETFKVTGKDAYVILAQIDESEISLRQELEDDVKTSFDQAIAIQIPISKLLLDRMKADGGGVEFIRRILHDEMTSGDMKSGFKKLEEPIPHRVDLSLEYLVSRPKYEKLFSKEHVEFCKKLMKKYNL